MKPKHALIGVNPANMEVCFLAGWTIESMKTAADDGLITIRTSWERAKLAYLFYKISEEQLMEISE